MIRPLAQPGGPDDDGLIDEMRGVVEAMYGPPAVKVPGLNVGRAYLGAHGSFPFGGDLVDVFHYTGGFTSVAVVDITGHGLAAAANAGLIKHALRAYASRGLNARAAVRSLNRLVIESSTFENAEDFYATVFFGIIQPDRRTMEYVSAGCETTYLISPGRSQLLPATGPLVGLMDDDAAFDHDVIRLAPDAIVAAVTDGFTEARNERLEFLGTSAVVDVILRHRANAVERQAEALTEHALEYAQHRLHDDVAALVLKIEK